MCFLYVVLKATLDVVCHLTEPCPQGQRWNKSFPLEDLLEDMERHGVVPNTHTYYHIILRYVEAHNLEMCLQCFAEMNARGVSPSLRTAQVVIELAASLGHPRLALDIAYAFEATSIRKLEHKDWMRILDASTACHFVRSLFFRSFTSHSCNVHQEMGVTHAWQRAVVDLGVTPVEGQCIDVLHTTARCGLPNLAMHAVQVLIGLQVPLEEHHLAPVLEAFCERRMLEEAFSIVNLMRSSGVQCSPETALQLTNRICDNIDQVDEAWSILEKMKQQEKSVDVVSLNAIIHAAILLNDLQRAIGTYKAFSDFGVKPTISTFNHLLSGCISASHRELGDKLLSELRELGLVPDTITFERMVILCLTQTVYEDAFFYLEEMKGQGYMPPISVYTALIRKCVVSGDVRWKIALDEMKECGYAVSPTLQQFIDTGGKMQTRARRAEDVI
jgi:pentatricopeptide repeat protein